MIWTKVLKAVGEIVLSQVAPEAINKAKKIADEIIEKQKTLIKIPDLKDVNIQEALRVLKDELNLTPTSALANPSLAYAYESENDVMYAEPRFGSRVSPKTTVKVYYLTQEVIDKSKELLKYAVNEFKVPHVIGLNVYEAREDLEALGLKINEKLEKPSLRFLENEDGQVTKVTYANKKKIGSKLRAGERLLLYYINEEVILASKTLKDNIDNVRQERIDKVVNPAKDAAKKISKGTAENTHKIARNIKKLFAKKRENLDKSEE